MSLTYAAQQTDKNSGRKTIAIAVVALIHVGFFYGFTHGLNVVNIVQPLKDTITVFIPEETKPATPPPAPKVKHADAPIDKIMPDTPPVVTPDIPLNTEPVDSAITADSTSTAEPAAPTSSFSITHRVNPAYPASSQRAGEAGTVLLDVIVGPNGVPTDVNVATSSGFSALDQAAVEAVRKWRFTVSEAGTAHLRLPVTFKLQTVR